MSVDVFAVTDPYLGFRWYDLEIDPDTGELAEFAPGEYDRVMAEFYECAADYRAVVMARW